MVTRTDTGSLHRRRQPRVADLWARKCFYKLGWNALRVATGNIASAFRNQRIQHVVGIANGGIIPAVLIAEALEVSSVSFVGCSRNASDAPFPHRHKPTVTFSTLKSVVDQRVLIIDDIVGDGTTLKFVVSFLRRRRAKTISTASIAVNHATAYLPDKHVYRVDDWLVFPWEPMPDGQQHQFDVINLDA